MLLQCVFPFWLTGIAACSQANQPMIQKLQETCCVKITSYTTFLGIAGVSFPRSNFYIHCHLKFQVSQKMRFWKWNFRAADTSLVIKVWSKVLCDRIHRLPNLTIWVCFSLMFLPKLAYYPTNNPNRVFFSNFS